MLIVLSFEENSEKIPCHEAAHDRISGQKKLQGNFLMLNLFKLVILNRSRRKAVSPAQFASIAAVLLLSAAPAFALNEEKIRELDKSLIAPMMASRQKGTLSGKGGVKIAYALFKPTGTVNGNIILVPGLTESYLKYGEVIYDLLEAGFQVFTYDHRGMGLSDRLTNDPQIVHVDAFEDYVIDFESFVSQIIKPRAKETNKPIMILAHSMGGLVSVFALARDSETYAKAALMAPMLEINSGRIPKFMAQFFVWIRDAVGAGKEYAPGGGPFDVQAATVEASYTTRSAARFAVLKDLWLNEPSSIMSGPSNRWVRESLKATESCDELATKIKVPLIIFQATDDDFVKPAGQDRFCSKTKSCRLIKISGAKHEILMETDTSRLPAMDEIVKFFSFKVDHTQ